MIKCTVSTSCSDLCFYGICAALFLLLLAAYSNHFDNPFEFDDFYTITQNAYEHDTRSLGDFFTDVTTSNTLPANRDYRPVLSVFYALSYAAGGGATWPFHASLFVCFLAIAVALFFFAKKIFDASRPSPANRFAALGTAGFYALHTANAETVNYIHAASDLLSALMIMLSLVLFQYAKSYRIYGLYLVPVALAMLIKITAAVYPAFLFLTIALFETGEGIGAYVFDAWQSLRGVLVKILPALLVCVALLGLWEYMLPDSFMPSLYTRLGYALAQPFVLVHYLAMFVLPVELSADADWQPVEDFFDARVLVGIVVLLSFLTFSFFAARQRITRPIAFGILWFFVASLPTSSGIIPMGEVMNDHRMFLPFIGLAIAAGWAFALFVEARPEMRGAILYVVLPCLFLAHAAGVHMRNEVWHSGESLWYDVTVKSPANGRGLMNYGLTQMAKGDYPRADDYYHRALAYVPTYSYLHINMGILADKTGKPEEAAQHFQSALQFGKNNPDAFYYYAAFLNGHGQGREAEPYLTTAIRLSPSSMNDRLLLMSIHADQGEWAALADLAVDSKKVDPNDARIDAYLALAGKNASRTPAP